MNEYEHKYEYGFPYDYEYEIAFRFMSRFVCICVHLNMDEYYEVGYAQSQRTYTCYFFWFCYSHLDSSSCQHSYQKVTHIDGLSMVRKVSPSVIPGVTPTRTAAPPAARGSISRSIGPWPKCTVHNFY